MHPTSSTCYPVRAVLIFMGYLHVATAAASAARGAKARLPANQPGNFYVDASCIDCDTCRWLAPDIFGRGDDRSFVARQPWSSEDVRRAAAAAIACPTGSIRTEQPVAEAKDVARSYFPAPVDANRLPRVFHLGHHAAESFGATPYLVSPGVGSSGVSFMVDSPRFSTRLAQLIEAVVGSRGPDMLLLTHIDDVGHHGRWKERWPEMKRVIHSTEVRGPDMWPYIETRDVELQLVDADAVTPDSSTPGSLPRWHLAPGLSAIHTPGHTPGSLCFLAAPDATDGDGCLFTGDHLALSGRLGRLDGFARYSQDTNVQAESTRALAVEPFLHILPGHGRRHSFGNSARREAEMLKAADEYATDPRGESAPGPLYLQPEDM